MEKFSGKQLNNPSAEKLPYEKLLQEIAEVKFFEMNNKEVGFRHDLHFEEIEVEKLTREDLDIFSKFKDGSLTRSEFDDYRIPLSKNEADNSRKVFMYWLANKMNTPEWNEKFYPPRPEKEKRFEF